MPEPSNRVGGDIGLHVLPKTPYGEKVWECGDLCVTKWQRRWLLYIRWNEGWLHIAERIGPKDNDYERWVRAKVVERLASTNEHLRKLAVQTSEVNERLTMWKKAELELGK